MTTRRTEGITGGNRSDRASKEGKPCGGRGWDLCRRRVGEGEAVEENFLPPEQTGRPTGGPALCPCAAGYDFRKAQAGKECRIRGAWGLAGARTRPDRRQGRKASGSSRAGEIAARLSPSRNEGDRHRESRRGGSEGTGKNGPGRARRCPFRLRRIGVGAWGDGLTAGRQGWRAHATGCAPLRADVARAHAFPRK